MLKEIPRILIVGDGLSAHVLAHRLESEGIPFLVIGKDSEGAASPAAWGLLNPVHFRSYGPSYGAAWYQGSLTYYKDLEHKFNRNFVHHAPLEHLDTRTEAFDHWSMAWETELHTLLEIPSKNSLGNTRVVLPEVAMVSVPVFLEESRAYLKARGYYQQAWFVWPYSDFSDRIGIEFAGQIFTGVVWAQGCKALESGPFKSLPIKPSKGEGAQFSTIPMPEQKHIKHQGMFAFQETPGFWRVGSTYSWSDLRPEPSAEALAELKARFVALTGIESFELEAHWAGFRPASPDRKPMVGKHPLYNQHFAFNGMGSKGLLMAPFLAKTLLEEIMGERDKVPRLCRLDRFSKRLITFKE